MTFNGWPAEALEFYEGLEADNSRSYWSANKAVYEEAVKAPMVALLAELEGEFGPGRIYRPYRDLRFSPDKTPYKTVMGASMEQGGYVQISAHGLAAASGMYHMATDQLERYRRAVAHDLTGGQLEKIIAAALGETVVITGRDSLKSAPRGYTKDHPRIELLRHKGLIAWQEWPAAAWLGTAAAKGRVVAFLRGAQPLRDWLDTHVGESELAE